MSPPVGDLRAPARRQPPQPTGGSALNDHAISLDAHRDDAGVMGATDHMTMAI